MYRGHPEAETSGMSTLRDGTVNLPLRCSEGHYWLALCRFTPYDNVLYLINPDDRFCRICRRPDQDTVGGKN